MTAPRSGPAEAEDTLLALCRNLIVQRPFQTSALAHGVGRGHCAAIGTDPNRGQPEAERQKAMITGSGADSSTRPGPS